MSLRVWLIGCLGALALFGNVGCNAVCREDCATASALIKQPAPMSPIVSITPDYPCTVTTIAVDGGIWLVVGVNEGNPADSGTCSIHETLADGTQLVATFGWARNGGTGCCAQNTHSVGPDPTFTSADGGTPQRRTNGGATLLARL